LGLTSFGGPIAHLGYYHREFVLRRQWVDEALYAQLLASCQFLPGPSSTQFGFSIGLLRAGWRGALAAFCAFTLPSALLMFAFAVSSAPPNGFYEQALLHGLKLVAVAVVAQGILAMARTLTPDRPRILLAVASLGLMQVISPAWSQLVVIALGAALGPLLCRSVGARSGAPLPLEYGERAGAVLLSLFAVLLLGACLVPATAPLLLRAAAAFYKTGSLVFGGGHVVLPLLKQAVVEPGWLSESDFLAGYGAAQAVPGPMFSVAAFLGARLDHGQGGALGAAVCLVSIFLPGLLLVSGVLPFWNRLARHAAVSRSMAGVNAAVVGLLAAALYDPLWVSAVHETADLLIALVGFVLLVVARMPALAVVAWCVAASVAGAAMGW
jgi:chromate transporter